MIHNLNNLPPIEGLTAVLVAAETGSFSAAAEYLNLTHGAISRRIASIENWLGAPLFERHGRGVRLTLIGRRFTRNTEYALNLIAESADRWRPNSGTQTIRLSILPSFSRIWLLPRLKKLQGVKNDLNIELVTEHKPTNLNAKEADIAIRYGSGNWENLETHLLFEESLVPVAAPDIAAALGQNAVIDDILKYGLLHDSDVTQWRNWLLTEGIKYCPRSKDSRFEDYDTVLAAAENGLGIALLRLPLAEEWLEKGRLIRVSKKSVANPQANYIVIRKNEDRGAILELVQRLLNCVA